MNLGGPPGRSRGPFGGLQSWALGLGLFDGLFEFEGEPKSLRDCTGCRYGPGGADNRGNGNQNALCILQGKAHFDGCR